MQGGDLATLTANLEAFRRRVEAARLRATRTAARAVGEGERLEAAARAEARIGCDRNADGGADRAADVAAAWYALGESNPCFRRERAAS